MVLDHLLVPAGDEDDMLDSGLAGLVHGILHDWPVDDRQHLLGHCLVAGRNLVPFPATGITAFLTVLTRSILSSFAYVGVVAQRGSFSRRRHGGGTGGRMGGGMHESRGKAAQSGSDRHAEMPERKRVGQRGLERAGQRSLFQLIDEDQERASFAEAAHAPVLHFLRKAVERVAAQERLVGGDHRVYVIEPQHTRDGTLADMIDVAGGRLDRAAPATGKGRCQQDVVLADAQRLVEAKLLVFQEARSKIGFM